jgi:hypothetical protein
VSIKIVYIYAFARPFLAEEKREGKGGVKEEGEEEEGGGRRRRRRREERGPTSKV